MSFLRAAGPSSACAGPAARRLPAPCSSIWSIGSCCPPTAALRDPRFRDPFGDFRPDYRAYTWREYGNRIGIFRLLDVLDRTELKVTVAANASACDRYPYLVDELLKRDYEFAAHGSHATRMLTSRMPEAEERDFIASSVERVSRASGKPCVGWIGQDYAEFRTDAVPARRSGPCIPRRLAER